MSDDRKQEFISNNDSNETERKSVQLQENIASPATPLRLSVDEISTVVRAVMASLSAPQAQRSLGRELDAVSEVKVYPTSSEVHSAINFKPPPGLPTFKQGDTEPVRYFKTLEQLFKDLLIPSHYWRLALLASTEADKVANNFVKIEMANVKWEELKSKFIERFKLQPLALHVALHSMRQGDEPVERFFNRFCEVAQQLQGPESTPHVVAAFIQALQPVLRKPTLTALRMKTTSQPLELSVACVAAREVESQLSTSEFTQYLITRKRFRQSPKRGQKRFNNNTSQNFRENTWEQKRTRVESTPDKPRGPSFTQRHSTSSSTGRPFRGRHNFRGRGRGGPKPFNTDRVEIIDLREKSNELEQIEAKKQENEIPRHPVPAEINNIRIIFKYDIGADRSILSKSFCDRNGIKYLPTQAQAQSFNALSEPSPLVGEVVAQIRVQDLTIEHKFFVGNLFVDGLFGEDLATKTAMVPLLPLSFPSQVIDEKLETPTTQMVGEEYDEKEVKQVHEHLELAIQANKQIAPTSFCTLEFAPVAVELIDDEPVYRAQYPIPAHLEEPFSKVLVDWLARRRIEPSKSHFNSPVTVVPKTNSDGSLTVRPCLDFRQLNAKLKATRWAAPVLAEVLGALAGKKYYAEFDLKEAYLQLPVRQKDKHKLAFSAKLAGMTQHFQFRGAPFGLWHLPGHFQEMMLRLFTGLDFVVIYLDNVVVASSSLEEHQQHCKQVIELLTKANLRLNTSKIKVARRTAAILGHLLSAEGIGPDPARLQALRDYPAPKSYKELQRFIGTLIFIRPFLPQAHILLEYLHKLKQDKKSFQARDEAKYQKALVEVKEGLKHVICTRPFEMGKPLGIATDASRVGVAAVLFYPSDKQPQPSSSNVIAMVARGLQKYEKSYPIFQLELLAILFAVQKFHFYIYGSMQPIQVLTDHSALVDIMTQSPIKQTIARWMFQLTQYNLVVRHIKGLSNILPDSLSRAEYPQAQPIKVSEVRFSDELKYFLQDRRFVPLSERKKILDDVHQEGHVARDQMMRKLVLERQLYWQNMAADVTKRVRQCAPCMKHNVAKWGYHPRRTASAEAPMQRVQIDLMELPPCQEYVAILVIICVFSGFLFLRPLKSKSAEGCAEAFLEIVWLFGPPLHIMSDNASDFVNKLWSRLLQLLGIQQDLIPAYYPLPKGRVERAIGSIRMTLRKYLEGETNWVAKLGLVQFRLNSLISAATKSTPFALMFARSPTFPTPEQKVETDDDWKQLQIEFTSIVQPTLADVAKSHRQVKILNRFTQPTLKPLLPGDQVMMKDHRRTDKMDQIANGPYTVIMALKHDQYLVKDAAGDGNASVAPRSHLRKTELSQQEAYEVEEILDSTTSHQGTTYLVKWKGYEEPSWISKDSFNDEALIRAYEAKHTHTKLPAKVQKIGTRASTRSRRK